MRLSVTYEQSFRQILQKVTGTQKKPTGSARERAKSERVQARLACVGGYDNVALHNGYKIPGAHGHVVIFVLTRRALVTSRRTVWLSVARFLKALGPVFFASSLYKKHRNIIVIVWWTGKQTHCINLKFLCPAVRSTKDAQSKIPLFFTIKLTIPTRNSWVDCIVHMYYWIVFVPSSKHVNSKF